MKKFYILTAAAILTGILFTLWGQLPRGADLTLVGAPEESSEPQPAFSTEELSALVQPAVVRIIQHVAGSAVIPKFKIDFTNLSVAVVPGAKPTVMPIDNYFSGRGFVVRSDGSIVTNAHVISDTTVKLSTAGVQMMTELLKEVLALSPEAKTKLNEMDEASRVAFGERLADFAIAQSSFTIVKTVRVAYPASNESDMQTLFSEGHPATVVAVHDTFYRDNRDVGLLKIDAADLPTLSFENTKKPANGMRVYAVEYPESADQNQKKFTESSFVQGVVHTLKDSRNKDFTIIETDIKISQGSSGGPLTDENGRAAGIVTFMTNPLDQNARNAFASAIPAQLVEKMLVAHNIEVSASSYETHLRQGFALQHEGRCKRAIDEFKAAAPMGENGAPHALAKYTAPFIADCASLIASGQSIDTRWDAIRAWWTKSGSVSPRFRTASSIILAALALFCILWFLKLAKSGATESGTVTPVPGASEQEHG